MKTIRTLSGRGGQILVLFAVLCVALCVICALTIDVGRMALAKAELQNAVDAAALAGASQLIGETVGNAQKRLALSEALRLAEANKVIREDLTLTAHADGTGLLVRGDATDDVDFGRYDSATRTFIAEPAGGFPSGQIVDSIRVRGRRTDTSPDGAIGLTFAGIFGMRFQATAGRAVGTQPRRYVMFVMDRSGSMCFDTASVSRYDVTSACKCNKSPTGWYWVPYRLYSGSSYSTMWMKALTDATGAIRTDFLPAHIRANLSGGLYFNYRSKDRTTTVQSGWIKAPATVSLYSRYTGSSYTDWRMETYYSVITSDRDYAVANTALQPITDSQDAAAAFVDLLNPDKDASGIVSYAHGSTLDHVLTADFPSLVTAIYSYDPREGTATPDGMKSANDEFIVSGRAASYGQRIMVLLTDGNANRYNGNTYDNTWATRTFMTQSVYCYVHQTVLNAMGTETTRARNNGIRIYTVSFGTASDTAVMPIIASRTQGSYYYAAEAENLVDIFVDIFYNLPPILTM